MAEVILYPEKSQLMKGYVLGFLLVLFALIGSASNGGNGTLSGKVMDKKTGEELIGVTVKIEGTNIGTVTDFEGKYNLSVPPGNYTIVFSYVSYAKKVIKDVEIKPKETSFINPVLEESKNDLTEVVITAQVKKESANAMLIQQKNAVSVSSGFSADMIRRTPDRTTADVIKRISGASIQDNKFAVVRGLSDRYNLGYLNGVQLPSTEADRKAFSLDIIPASVIDNMQIIKGSTPDMPADFAGGIIQINTKDIPDENMLSVQLGGQYHSLTTFQSGLKSDGSATDFLGFDNGKRALPNGVMTTEQYKDASWGQLPQQTKLFNNNFQPVSVGSFKPNTSFQLTTSRRFKHKIDEFGYILAYSYNNTTKYEPFTQVEPWDLSSGMRSYDTSKQSGRYSKSDVYRNSVINGGVFNFAFKHGNNNKFSLKNLLSYTSDDRTVHRTATAYDVNMNHGEKVAKNDDYFYNYQWGRLFSSQFTGEHLLTKSKIKIKYVGGLTDMHKEIPDYKRLLYQATKNGAGSDYLPFVATVNGGKDGAYDPSQSGRFFSVLNERMYSGSYDVTVPVEIKGLSKVSFKAGGMHFYRTRSYNARNFLFSSNLNDPNYSDTYAQAGLQQGPGQIFSNGGIDSTYKVLTESTQKSDAYNASSQLNAWYGMVDFKMLSKLRVITGVRMEMFNMKLTSYAQGDRPVNLNKTTTDFLPSINLVYELTSKTNLRASYAKTLSRPEFREFAPLAYYDIIRNAVVVGNDTLKRTLIDNYDFKFEFFPTQGQLLSINPFYKRFTLPVENVLRPGTSTTYSYENAISAQSFGIEFEAKSNFAFLNGDKKSKVLENLSIFMNYAYIYSNVKLNNKSSTNDLVTSRPMQGQSPYVFNAGLFYSDPIKKIDCSLSANMIGRRIAYVAPVNYNLIWENPRFVLDASISKTFYKKLLVKLTLGDILAQPLIYYQDLNKNKTFDAGTDVQTYRYKYGRTIQLAVGYTF